MKILNPKTNTNEISVNHLRQLPRDECLSRAWRSMQQNMPIRRSAASRVSCSDRQIDDPLFVLLAENDMLEAVRDGLEGRADGLMPCEARGDELWDD